MMNEKKFEEAVRTTLKELCSMSREEFHAEMAKRKNSDFARIFSEANEIERPQCRGVFNEKKVDT